MKRNVIRIVCNPFMNNKVSYFFKNEMDEWLLLSGSSPLARQYYTKTDIMDRSKEIVEKIDEIYNRKNRGVDIFFQGTTERYEQISEAIKTYLSGRDVSCQMEPAKIAVVGKRNVGKTTLIKGIENRHRSEFEVSSKRQYAQYEDKHNHIDWIEVNGIDFGTGNVEEMFSTVSGLVKEGLSKVVYCISGVSGHIDEAEISMIDGFKQRFPSVDVITTVTMCYKDEVQTVIDEIEKIIGHREVFPTLAQEYKTSMGGKGTPSIVEPFGLTELVTFIFEGKRLPRNLSIIIEGKTKQIDHSESVGKPNQPNVIVEKPESVKKYTPTDEASKPKPTVGPKKQDIPQRPMPSLTKPDVINGEIKGSEKVLPKSDYRKIAVVGKTSAGKSTLIEGCGKKINHAFTITSCDGYQIYEDKIDSLQWCEVKGIDITKGKIEEAFSTVVKLADDDAIHLIYCISMETGKVEESEIKLIADIKKRFPDLKITIVLTKCYQVATPALLKLMNELKPVAESGDIIQTLAKEYKTRIKDPSTGEVSVIPSFNLDVVYKRVKGEYI